MPKRRDNKTRARRTGAPRARKPRENKPRPQMRAGSSISRGIASIANQFMPGAGMMVRGVSSLMGYGAYDAKEAETLFASSVPQMHHALDRGIRIAHHEYLGDVTSAVGFSCQQYALNPGLAATFPWLSTVASAFQEYEINGLVFYFKSTSANALNSVNTALGQIMGAVLYNPVSPTPTSKLAMLAISSARDGKPSESNLYPVECKADMVLFRNKLIRTTPLALGDDLAKYDHGNFFLGANGSQAAATVGELHIAYDVLLKKPRLCIENAASAWYYREMGLSSDATGADPYENSDPTVVVGNSLGVTRDDMTNIFTIPAASVVAGTRYRFTSIWGGTAAIITAPIVTYTNATAAAVPGIFNLASYTVPANGVNSVRLAIFNEFVATNSNVPLTVQVGTAGTTPTAASWDVTISEVA